MKYKNEMTDEVFESELPRYATGRMSAEERAGFEDALRASSERTHAAEEMRETAQRLSGLLGADRGAYTLDPERIEALRAAAERIHPFARRAHRFRIAAQVAVAAAALVVGAFMGVDQGQQQFRIERGLDPVPIAEQQMLQSVLNDPSFLYRYPPGYGLDRDDSWRLANGKPWLDQEPTHPFAGAVLSNEESRPNSSTPWYVGLDGPTPYYPMGDLSWGYI